MTDVFIHPSAIVDQPCQLGAGTKIWHFCHLMKDCHLGMNCQLGQNVFVGQGVRIGNNVKVQNNVSIYQGVELADDVFLGPSMVFTNVRTPRSAVDRREHFEQTRVQKGATIGANATVICGNTIGAYAFIGAGAVVTNHVPDHALMVGNPAIQTGWMCTCGAKLSKHLDCPECGATYVLQDHLVRAGKKQ